MPDTQPLAPASPNADVTTNLIGALADVQTLRRHVGALTGSLQATQVAVHEANARIRARDKAIAAYREAAEEGVDAVVARFMEVAAAVERVEALAAWAAKPWRGEELDTTDGTILLVNDNAVWVRSDSLNTTRTDGDWYPLDNTGDQSASSIAEVLGFDQPPQDRNVKRFEALITADDLRKTLAGEA